MSWYTITKVEEKKHWSNKFGDFITYDVALMGEDGVECPSCQLNQKDTTPAPMMDERIHGYIEDSDYGFKFKKTQPEDGGSSSSYTGHSGASGASTGQANSDTQNQIIRQSMVKAAVELCVANNLKGGIKVSDVLMVADQLVDYAQTGRVGQAGMEPDGGSQSVPFDKEPD